MTMTKKYIEDKDGNRVLPITHLSAVKDSNGNTLEDILWEEKEYDPTHYSGMGKIVLQKNMVSDVNTLTQAMLAQTNTIYVIKYDFVLGENITIPTNCILEFDGGSISAGSGENKDTITGNNTSIQAGLIKIFNTDITLAGSWNVNEAYPEWFGAKGDGVTDDTAAFVALANTPFENISFKGNTHYRLNSGMVFKHDISINGNNARLDFDGTNGGYEGISVKKDNVLSELTNITSISATKDTFVINVNSTTGVNVGDLLVLVDDTEYSWARSRAYYMAGDIVCVKEASSNTITTVEPLTQNYGGTGTNMKLCKLNSTKVNIHDLEIVGDYSGNSSTLPNTVNPIYLFGGRDVELKNLNVSNSNHALIGLEYCYNVIIDGVFGYSEAPVTEPATLNYGIAIGTSKNVVVSNCDISTTRHAIACTGGHLENSFVIPNRYITITNCIFNGFSEAPSVDAHDNTQYYSISNCAIKNGIGIGASNFSIENNQVFNHTCIYGIACGGVNCTGLISGNNIQGVLRSPSAQTGIIIVSPLDSDNPIQLKISDNIIANYGEGGYLDRRGAIFLKAENVSDETNMVDISGNTCIYGHCSVHGSSLSGTLNIHDNKGLDVNFCANKTYVYNNHIYIAALTTKDELYVCNNTFRRADTTDLRELTIYNENGNTSLTTIEGNKFIVVTRLGNSQVKDVVNVDSADVVKFVNNTFELAKGVTGFGNNSTPLRVVSSNTCIVRDNKQLYNSYKEFVLNGTTVIKDRGTLLEKPSSYNNPGDVYFATDKGTNGAPIWWNGSAWVDATGATV